MSTLAHLKHVSLRTKIIVPMIALSVLPTAGLGVVLISRMKQALREGAVERVAFDTGARARAIEGVLHAIQGDLRFLAQSRLLGELAAARTAGEIDRVNELRGALERELILFSQGKRAFYQLRYLDLDGREVIRLNMHEGRAVVVPVSQLQNKGRRYYVKATRELAPGAVYISPMDLNMEHGRVETPPRPVVRFGTPVASGGRRQGSLILNLDVRHILALIEPLAPRGEAFLVDADGRYLAYVGPSAARRERCGLSGGRSLKDDYGAEASGALTVDASRTRHAETQDAILSTGPIQLDPADPARRWGLVVTRPRALFEAPIEGLALTLSLGVAMVLAVVSLIGVLVAHHLSRPVVALRRAMGQIAAERGALQRSLPDEPPDEIEALSREFRSMAHRLEQAQERLQGLQAGMAEADRRSSIGQLTAGLMRELAEPLGALSGRLQAAAASEEPSARALAVELRSEVQRVEETLGSFSRLAEEPAAVSEVVGINDVARSSAALLAPELRQRGLELVVSSEPGVPPIEGDPTRLRQLLVNLILNAADAQPRSKTVHLELAPQLSEDPEQTAPVGVLVRVRDDGVGIPTERLVQIWDPFHSTKPAGVGLGLAICRHVVEDHGGRIELSSQVGQGTTVTVIFPKSEANVAAE